MEDEKIHSVLLKLYETLTMQNLTISEARVISSLFSRYVNEQIENKEEITRID